MGGWKVSKREVTSRTEDSEAMRRGETSVKVRVGGGGSDDDLVDVVVVVPVR